MQDDPVLLQTRSSLVTSDRKSHPLFVSLHLSDTCSNTAKRQSGKASSAREASSHTEYPEYVEDLCRGYCKS